MLDWQRLAGRRYEESVEDRKTQRRSHCMRLGMDRWGLVDGIAAPQYCECISWTINRIRRKTDGGFANGIPRYLLVRPSTVPTNVPLSSCTVGRFCAAVNLGVLNATPRTMKRKERKAETASIVLTLHLACVARVFIYAPSFLPDPDLSPLRQEHCY